MPVVGAGHYCGAGRTEWRPASKGRSRKVRMPGAASQTYGMAFTACIAVQVIAGAVVSSPLSGAAKLDACSKTQRSEGSPSMVTLHWVWLLASLGDGQP